MVSFFVMKEPSVENALAPLEFIISVAGTLMLLICLAVGLGAVFDRGDLFGIGAREACVAVPDNALNTGFQSNNPARVDGLQRDISAIPRQIEICDRSPSAPQRLLAFLGTFPSFAFALGFLAYAWWLTRTARREGLFSPEVALGVLRIGLYVLVGAVLVAVLRSWADWQLLITMTDSAPWDALVGFFHLSWSTLIGGFGLLTVGRVMGESVRMQREIDHTV
jgi:hypothetical protein